LAAFSKVVVDNTGGWQKRS